MTDIKEGEVRVTVMGHTGSGKSAVLTHIAQCLRQLGLDIAPFDDEMTEKGATLQLRETPPKITLEEVNLRPAVPWGKMGWSE